MTARPMTEEGERAIEDIPCPVCGAPHDQLDCGEDVFCKNCASRTPKYWWRRNLLLSSSAAERVMREALEQCAAPWDSGQTTVPGAFPLMAAEFQRRMNIAGDALVALSARAGEEEQKQARSPSALSAPTDRLQSKE